MKGSILYLILMDDPINNGIIDSQVISVLKKTVASGYQVTLFSVPSHRAFCRHSHQVKNNFIQNLEKDGIKFYCCPLPFLSNGFIKILLLPFVIVYILPFFLLFLLRLRVDIIHCRSYPASFIGMIVKNFSNKKYIFDMRGIYPEEGSFLFKNWNINSINYKCWKVLERYMLLSADKVVVVSEVFKKYILSNNLDEYCRISTKISIINCGINVDRLVKFTNRDCLTHRPIRLVYSGTLDGWTTPALLANTFIEIMKCNNEYDFLLNVYTTTKISNIVDAFKLALVPFDKYNIEHVMVDSVFEKLCTNDIAILVREDSIVNAVSFPVKLGEYISARLPVVVNSAVKSGADFVEQYKVGKVLCDDYYIADIIENYNFFVSRCDSDVNHFADCQLDYIKIYDDLLAI